MREAKVLGYLLVAFLLGEGVLRFLLSIQLDPLFAMIVVSYLFIAELGIFGIAEDIKDPAKWWIKKL